MLFFLASSILLDSSTFFLMCSSSFCLSIIAEVSLVKHVVMPMFSFADVSIYMMSLLFA